MGKLGGSSYLFLCGLYNFIEFLRKVCLYNETFDKVLAMLGVNLKGSKLGQILHADKTGFRRLGHKFAKPSYYRWCVSMLYIMLSACKYNFS